MFPHIDTYGVPLDVVVEKLKDHGLMPDWLEYYEDAIEAGAKPSSLVTKMSEAVGDVYGPTFREQWEVKFKALIPHLGVDRRKISGS